MMSITRYFKQKQFTAVHFSAQLCSSDTNTKHKMHAYKPSVCTWQMF